MAWLVAETGFDMPTSILGAVILLIVTFVGGFTAMLSLIVWVVKRGYERADRDREAWQEQNDKLVASFKAEIAAEREVFKAEVAAERAQNETLHAESMRGHETIMAELRTTKHQVAGMQQTLQLTNELTRAALQGQRLPEMSPKGV